MQISAQKYGEMLHRYSDAVSRFLEINREMTALHQLIMNTLSDDPAIRDGAHDALYTLAANLKAHYEIILNNMAQRETPGTPE